MVGPRWTWVEKAILCTLVFFGLLHLAGPTAGRLEGAIVPVAVDFEPELVPGYRVRFHGTMKIVRPVCNFVALDVYLANEGRRVPVSVVFEDGIKVRPGGGQQFGPWRLQGVEPEQWEQVKIEARHLCPWRPWETTTRLR